MVREPGAEPGRLEEKQPKPVTPQIGPLIIKSLRPGVPDEELTLKGEAEPAAPMTGSELLEILESTVAGKPLPAEHLSVEYRNHVIEPGHEIAPAGEVGKVRANLAAKYPKKSSKHI